MAEFTPGTYGGIAQGFASKIKLNVTVSEDRIETIEIVEEHDTHNIGSLAIPVVANAIIDAQSTDVDSVAGATYSSRGTKDAVESALRQARGEEESSVKFHEGNYTASTDNLEVRMSFSPYRIEAVDYELKGEELKGDEAALDEMKEQIISLQRTEFDSVSGASKASRSLRDAVSEIWTEANAESLGDRLADSPIKDEARIQFKHGSLTIDQIEAVLNGVGEELLFVGPDLRFQWFSEGHRLYQYSDAAIGQLYTDCHPPHARASSRKVASELISRKRKSYTFWYESADGDLLFITYQAMFDKQERFIGMLGWTVDVQPYIDVANANVPVQRRLYTDPNVPNPLNWETEESLRAYQNGGAEHDPMRDFALSELERLEEVAREPGGEYDSVSTASQSDLQMQGEDDPIMPSPAMDGADPSQSGDALNSDVDGQSSASHS